MEDDRERFARTYFPVVRAYLAARWRGSQLTQDLDDALQEVFIACFEPGGALDGLDPDRAGGFRPFLFGVARNVARRVEARRAPGKEHQPPSAAGLDRLPADEEELSRVFDPAWSSDATPVPTALFRQTLAAPAGGPPSRAGRYLLDGAIGQGGMGAVLRGLDPELGRELAVKVLRPEHWNNPAVLRRFVEEAQIGGQLQHPGMVPVYDVVRFPDGRPYFIMKLVRGLTLRAAELAGSARPSPVATSPP